MLSSSARIKPEIVMAQVGNLRDRSICLSKGWYQVQNQLSFLT